MLSLRRLLLTLAALVTLATSTGAVRAEVDVDCEPFDVAANEAATPSAQASGGGTELLVILPRDPAGGVGAEDLVLAPGATVVDSVWSPLLCSTMARIRGPGGVAPESLVTELPDGAIAVDNATYETGATDVAPGQGTGPDPYRPLQYGLDQLGVDAAAAVTQGRGARIAMLDSRPDMAHPDLGHIELLSIEPGPPTEPASHGTLIAGVLGATEYNAFGIAGVAPHAEVLAIPVCRSGREPGAPDQCKLFDMVRGLDLAWAHRAQVFNLSLVGPPNPVLERAMARLDALGVLLVAAAGNEATEDPRYPAAYPTVIGVGAVGQDGEPYAQGNRGPTVEITAPGVEIVSTVPGGGFAFSDGTSLATAHISGLLGLLVARSGDPAAARSAMFQAGQVAPGSTRQHAALPTVCASLALLGFDCRAP